MSRLIDRILTGCQPCRLSNIIRREDFEVFARSQLQKGQGPIVDEKAMSAEVERIRRGWKANDPVARDAFDLERLIGIPVFAADDVGAYFDSLPKPTRMEDQVASMAPPFEKFFVRVSKGS